MEYTREEQIFNRHLNGINGSVTIAGITFCASQILRECDPIAYRIAVTDYIDDLREYCDDEELTSMGLTV